MAVLSLALMLGCDGSDSKKSNSQITKEMWDRISIPTTLGNIIDIVGRGPNSKNSEYIGAAKFVIYFWNGEGDRTTLSAGAWASHSEDIINAQYESEDAGFIEFK